MTAKKNGITYTAIGESTTPIIGTTGITASITAGTIVIVITDATTGMNRHISSHTARHHRPAAIVINAAAIAMHTTATTILMTAATVTVSPSPIGIFGNGACRGTGAGKIESSSRLHLQHVMYTGIAQIRL